MTDTVVPRIGFIGIGKVGTVLSRVLADRGYPIVALWNRTYKSASTLADILDIDLFANFDDVVKAVDVIFLTVSDDALHRLPERIVESTDVHNKIFVHTSGAHNVDVLQVLRSAGALVGGLHPAYPFANVDSAIENLAGATFAIETYDDGVRSYLQEMVIKIGGQILIVPPEQKALYHAALVLASNYTVTLYDVAMRILETFGDTAMAQQALNPLMHATVNNLLLQGTPLALTGPLVRGDVGTIESHLAALTDHDPAMAQLYCDLAYHTLSMAKVRGTAVDAVETLLNKQKDS